MIGRTPLSLCVVSGLCLVALTAEANIQSNRWFYDMMQEGRDVHITLQLIEEEPPNFETTFMLTRGGEILFEGRQFVREEADEKVGPGACIEDAMAFGEELADCDSDGAEECAGVCGTAYRYEFVDICVPNDHPMYNLYDEATLDGEGVPDHEGYYYIFDLQATDDDCLDTDSPEVEGDTVLDPGGCSVSRVDGSASEAGLAALMLVVGLWFLRSRAVVS